MLYVGLISGTSADAIDSALLNITESSVELISAIPYEYPPQLQASIRAAFQGPPSETIIKTLDEGVGQCFADAALAIIKKTGTDPDEITAIGSHGQTLRHEPDLETPYSIQVGSGKKIANATGILTINDFRRADILAGGQGAPLAPALHAALFRDAVHTRGILNIGGIANITILPADADDEVKGFDTGPGNTLMDAWVRRCRNQPFDTDGTWARSGHVNQRLLTALLSDPYFRRVGPKSTGFEYFNLKWLEQTLTRNGLKVSEVDVQATLLALTTDSIANSLPQLEEIYVCGGGIHNSALMQRLTDKLDPIPVASSGKLGLDPDWVEASTFAWLAHRRLQGMPGNLPSVTGAREAVLLGEIHKPL